jgi:co-chaperonin GroES (HSP10)
VVELKPMNKYLVIKAIKEDEKVGGGLLYAPGSALEKHKTGKIVAIAPCDEAKDLHTGDIVLYDSIGSVDHRIGNQMFTTVKVLNIIAIVKEVE